MKMAPRPYCTKLEIFCYLISFELIPYLLMTFWLANNGFLCSWHIFTFDFVGGLLLTNDFDTYKRIFFGNILMEKYLQEGIFPLMLAVIFFFYINFYLFWVCTKYFSLSAFVTADPTNFFVVTSLLIHNLDCKSNRGWKK